MTEQDKELKIEFAPGCFDSFEGSQEELDELVNQIKEMFFSGEILEKSRELTEEDFDELPDDVKEQIFKSAEGIKTDNRNLQ